MYIYPDSHFFKLPEGSSDQIGVLAEPMAVSYALDIAKGQSALPNQGFGSGDTVVVYGVGPLGLCNLIKAKLLGAGSIIAVDKSPYRLQFAKEFGAAHALDAGTTTPAQRREFVLGLTDGRSADMVVECAGVPSAVIEGIEMLRQGRTFVEEGHFVDVGAVQLNPHRHLCAKNIRLIGQMNLAYTGIMPSIHLLMANQDRYDFDRIVTHSYHFMQSLDGLLKSMSPDCMKVVIHS